jgi:hypothetical protein
MISYVALWAISSAIAVPLVLYAAFIRPNARMRQVPPVWRAAPLLVLSSVGGLLALTPPHAHGAIVQLGWMSIQFLTLSNSRFIERRKVRTSILGLNERDKD